MTRHLKHTYAATHTQMHTRTHTHPERHHIYALNKVYLHIMQIICLNIVKYAVPSQQPSQAPIQQDRGEVEINQ